MMLSSILPTLALLSSLHLASAETILGAFIFHRHGDRTPKSLPPANLTVLGYDQVYQSGQYYHSRYIDSSSAQHIAGLSSSIVNNQQLSVSAPADTVLQNSATGFLQGLYPPVGSGDDVLLLANGTTVQAPLNGYQLVPVSITETGGGSENNGWLQDASQCANAEASSNEFFQSTEYTTLLSKTNDFYQNLVPVVNGTFTSDYVTFKNAYTVYDLIHVAEIHNSTINSSSLLTNDVLFQLRTLADTHEWGLAYNETSNARAVAGMQLIGEILTALNTTLEAGGSESQLTIQFGAYATFMSFFGIAQLPAANPDFYGIVDYASSISIELFSTADSVSADTYTNTGDLMIRFLFHNGTATNASAPVAYPLFGQSETEISYNSFVNNLTSFGIFDTQGWCTVCGNTTGICAPYADSSSSASAPSSGGSGDSGNGLSPAVNGVIGAMVTLGVLLAAAVLFLTLGPYRLAKKGATGAVTAASASKA